MNRQEYLMTQAISECCEVAHRISKAQQFGMEQVQEAAEDQPCQNPERLTNRERIIQEYTDLIAVMEMAGFPLNLVLGHRINDKIAKVERYMDLARSEGTLSA